MIPQFAGVGNDHFVRLSLYLLSQFSMVIDKIVVRGCVDNGFSFGLEYEEGSSQGATRAVP